MADVPQSSTINLTLDETESSGKFTNWVSISLVMVILILAIVVIFYGDVPLPKFPQFVPLHVAFVFLLDTITAFLLFGQFHYRRILLYLLLGSGYLLNAMISIPFLLAFPGGLQTEGGIIGGPQSAIWLWHYWHILFPVIVTTAIIVHNATHGQQLNRPNLWPITVFALVVVMLVVIALSLSVTYGHNWLPELIDVTRKPPLTTAFYWAGGSAAVATLIALIFTFRQGSQRTVLYLWLAVTMLAFLADIVSSLSANARYTLGWYFGRVEAIIAASVLLMVFLAEILRLYDRLSSANSMLLHLVTENQLSREILVNKNHQLELLSKTDHLTQLLNRQAIENELVQLINTYHRYGHSFSLILIDIDHFKEINDSYGHNIGDEVLRILGRVIKKRLRSTDTAGRWGGEEFLIVCSETELAAATAFAEELRELIYTSNFQLNIPLSASFGVVEYQADEDVNTLVGRVDEKLYAAKNNGRNQVVSA